MCFEVGGYHSCNFRASDTGFRVYLYLELPEHRLPVRILCEIVEGCYWRYFAGLRYLLSV